MKQVLWIPVALLLGLVVGAWGPRTQLQASRAEVKRLEELLRQGGTTGTDRFDGITRMLKIPAADKNSRRKEPQTSRNTSAATTNASASVSESNGTEVAAQQTPDSPRANAQEQERRQRRGLAERIDEAMELWRLRSDVVRSTFISNAHLSPEEAVQFDVVVEAMNMRLGERIQTWAEAMKTDDFVMNEETGIRMMNDLGNVMVLTYDEMNRKMPEDWHDNAGKEFSLTDMIDPSVATPLVDVESKLGQRNRPRGLFRR